MDPLVKRAIEFPLLSPAAGLFPPDVYVLHLRNPTLDIFTERTSIKGTIASAFLAKGEVVVNELNVAFLTQSGSVTLLRSNDPQERISCFYAARKAFGRFYAFRYADGSLGRQLGFGIFQCWNHLCKAGESVNVASYMDRWGLRRKQIQALYGAVGDAHLVRFGRVF